MVVTRRDQRGDGPGTTTRRTQAGPWTLVRTDGSAWGPASLKEEERRRQIRESGQSFPTDDFFFNSLCSFIVQMVASHDLFHGRGIGHSGQTLPFVESALSCVGKTRPICCVARHVLD